MTRTFYINFYPDGLDGNDAPEAYAYTYAGTVCAGGMTIEVAIPDPAPAPTPTVRVVV